MPKELIDNAWYGQFGRDHSTCAHGLDVIPPECPGREVVLDDSRLKVGWTKDQAHVEVAVVQGDSPDGVDDEAWHMQMDRVGINRLIRTLRKARDAAFGADA